jgi:class 3 adenylate cyclase
MKQVIMSVIIFGVIAAGTQSYIHQNIEMPFTHNNRSQKVKLSDDIKVYALNDMAAEQIGGVAIGNTSWLSVIASLLQRKPKAIIIDHTFDFKEQLKDASLGLDINRLAKASSTRIVAAAMLSDTELLNKSTYTSQDLKSLQRHPTSGVSQSIPTITSRYIYEPHTYLRPAFTGIGHRLYSRSNYVAPLLRVDSNSFLPAMALQAASAYYYLKNTLHVNDKAIPVNASGDTSMLWAEPNDYAKRVQPLSDLLGPGIHDVTEKDYVILIPQYYNGSYATVPSLIGEVHPILYQWTLLNSILEQRWIVTFEYPIAFGIALLILLLSLDHWYRKRHTQNHEKMIAASAVLIALIYGTLAALLNLNTDFQIPLVLPMLSGIIFALLGLGQAYTQSYLRQAHIQNALSGLAPKSEIERLIKYQNHLHTPHEKIVTMVAIEIAGYAQISDATPAPMAFARLKRLHDFLQAKVQSANGFIAEYNADHLLCVFGVDSSQESLSSHADKAIEFARSLQREHVGYIKEAHALDEAFYPLRMGIHTAKIAFGDLGDKTRIHYTILGGAVELCRQVMEACDLHSIAMSRSSVEMSSIFDQEKDSLKTKTISIKNKASSIEILELDILENDVSLRHMLYDAFLTHAKMARIEKRFFLENPSCVDISFKTSDAKVILVNYSRKGFCIKSPLSMNIGHYEEIDFKVSEANDSFCVTLQIKWICPESDGYLYGCYVKDEQQMLDVFTKLQNLDKPKIQKLSEVG